MDIATILLGRIIPHGVYQCHIKALRNISTRTRLPKLDEQNKVTNKHAGHL